MDGESNSQESGRAGEGPSRVERFGDLVAVSATMVSLFATLRKLTASSATVLLQGETGVGKDLVARALHAEGVRASGPFVELNCAAIPATLVENELFGHESEAYTGANHRHPGKVERAGGGTLFLDEIGELDLSSQAKLLRVLQDRVVERLGGVRPIRVDVRVIAATNRDLAAEVDRGRFREDLYYRLSVCPIHIPPLRERPEDIEPLFSHFVERFAAHEGRHRPRVSSEAMKALVSYGWPGNVRELENVARRVVIGIGAEELGAHGVSGLLLAQASQRSGDPEGLQGESEADVMPLADIERLHILHVLRVCRGNLSEAARLLGIGRTTLYRKIEKYRLDESARPR